MTTTFDPKFNRNFSILDDNYLSCNSEGGLTVTPKKERFLVQWFFGKVIHWILHFNEHISRVREVFQQQVSAGSDVTKATVHDTASLCANAKYFNDRVIKPHNNRWICSILFWNKVPLIETDQLESLLKSEIAINKRLLEQCDLIPSKISDVDIPLDAAIRFIQSLRHVSAIAAELKDLETIVEEKNREFVKVVDHEINRINALEKLTSTDFAIFEQLCNLQNHQALSLGLRVPFKGLKELVFLNHNESKPILDEIKKPAPDLNKLPPSKVKEFLSFKFVTENDKNLLKSVYLRFWQHRFDAARESNEKNILTKLQALARSDKDQVHLQGIEGPEVKEFDELLKSHPDGEVKDVVAAKQSYEDQLKHAKAVIEPVKRANELLKAALKKPFLITQDIEDLEAIATAFGKQKYHQQLEDMIELFKSAEKCRMKCQEILNAISAEINAREEAHAKLGVIDTPPVVFISLEERRQLDPDPNSPLQKNYDILWKHLENVRNLSKRCVEIHTRLNGESVGSISNKDFSDLEITLKSLPEINTFDAQQAAPRLAKKHQEFIDQIAKRQPFQTRFNQLLSQLKEMAEKPQEHKKQLSLYFWLGSKGKPSLSQQLLDISDSLTNDTKSLLGNEISKCFPRVVLDLNADFITKYAQAWKKAEVPQFNEEELAALEKLAKDSSVPLHFALQLALLVKMQKLQFHPRMKSTGKPEHEQLISEWSLCKDLLTKPSLTQDFSAMLEHFIQKVQKRIPKDQIALGTLSKFDTEISTRMEKMITSWVSESFEAHKKAPLLLEANEAVRMLMSFGYPAHFSLEESSIYEKTMPDVLTLLARVVHNYERMLPAIKTVALNTKSWENSFIPLKILLKQSAAFAKPNFDQTKILVANLVQHSHQLLYDELTQCGCEPFKKQPSEPTDGDDQAFARNAMRLMVNIYEQSYPSDYSQDWRPGAYGRSIDLTVERLHLVHQSNRWNRLIYEILKNVRMLVSQFEKTLIHELELANETY